MRAAVVAVALWAGLTAPAGAFTVDMEEAAIEAALGVVRVRSLAVGDRAFVSAVDFCRGEDGSLRLRGLAVVTRPTQYGASVEILVRGGRTVAVTLREGSRGGGRADLRDTVDVMLSRGRCAAIAAAMGQPVDGLAVISVNGRERLSQLIEDVR